VEICLLGRQRLVTSCCDVSLGVFVHCTIFAATSKLRMQPDRNDRHWPAVTVVGGVVDELIVERDVPQRRHGVAIIGLDDLFEARVRQDAVADNDPQAAGVEIGLMRAAYAVDGAGNPENVSSGRPHGFPDWEIPAAAVRSMSVIS